VGSFVGMSDQDADAHILRDVSPVTEGSAWRWTFQRPELRFWVESTTRQKLAADFAIAVEAFKVTGPVMVSFYVNAKLLGKQACPQPGNYHFEKAVPAAWLRTDRITVVAAEVDKIWVSPVDGARLGFVLTRIGFVN